MGTRIAQFDALLSGYRDPNTGLVGAGYTVYFYAAGTTTAKDVWTAYDKTGGAVQSVVLDATGSALVFGDGVYKLVVKNLSAATVDTFDGVKVEWFGQNVVTKTADYTITGDDDTVLADTTGNAINLTLPPAVGISHPILIKRISAGANDLVILAYGSETIDGAASYTISIQNGNVTLVSDGANWYGSAQSTDADTLNGFGTGTDVNTIPVRGTGGDIPGNVSGYAIKGIGGDLGPAAFSKLKIIYATAATVTLTADAIVLNDPDGNTNRVFSTWNSTANITASGANGLDTGVESSGTLTWYNIFAIGKEDGTQAVLLSLSATAPTMPDGYVFRRLVGCVANNASNNFIPFQQYGNISQYTASQSISTGNSGDPTVPTWTAFAVRSTLKIVPPAAVGIGLIATCAGAAATIAAPNNSFGKFDSVTAPPPLNAYGTNSSSAVFALESDSIYYASNATTSAALLCHSFVLGL